MKMTHKVWATALLITLAGAAHADAIESQIRERVVSYADLNLNQETDAQKLYKRIRTAARDVCSASGVLTLTAFESRKHCIEEATSRAIASVQIPSLTRYAANQPTRTQP